MRGVPVLASISALLAAVLVARGMSEPPPRDLTLFDLPAIRIERLRLEALRTFAQAQNNQTLEESASRQLARLEQREAQVPAGSTCVPSPVRSEVAVVAERNTRWDERRLSLVTEFQFAPRPAESTPFPGTSAAEQLLNTWMREGTAAGLHGIVYDNRDRKHSALNPAEFPGLTRVEYSPEATASGADWGMRPCQAFACPAFGNSSTAQTAGPLWRSNPRMLLHDNVLMAVAHTQFFSNQLYCYPEHQDFDGSHGDVFPANTACWVLSLGSSGSDQPFLKSIALTLAALRPEVREKLESRGLLMAAVQVLLRRSQRSAESDEDYFSGPAHPIVFRSAELDSDKMVRLAHELTLETLPAITLLKIEDEDSGIPGRDYFHPLPAERLFDTPSSVARVHRSSAFRRRMVVDAGSSFDLSDRPLTFRWVVLHGDPQRVQIRHLTDTGSRAELIIQWNHRATAEPGLTEYGPTAASNRTEIGVFAVNGVSAALPAFVNTFTLANEKRVYSEDGLIQSIDYGDPKYRHRYVDPLIDFPKDWRDDYHYRPDRTLLGWTRTFPDGTSQEFNASGQLIRRTSDSTEHVIGNVRYEAAASPAGTLMVKQIIGELVP